MFIYANSDYSNPSSSFWDKTTYSFYLDYPVITILNNHVYPIILYLENYLS